MNWRPIASSGRWISAAHRGGDRDGITLFHGQHGAARLGQDQARGNKSIGVAQ